MSKRLITNFIILLCLSCLVSSSVIGIILSHTYAQNQYRILSSLAQNITESHPDLEQFVIKAIKDSLSLDAGIENTKTDLLIDYGFTQTDFIKIYGNNIPLTVILLSLVFALLLSLFFQTNKSINRRRISDLTYYLEKINTEHDASVLPDIEDEFSQLQDEIYKTVIKLRQTSEMAVQAQKSLSGYLADISHQIKTPVATISIMAQLLDNEENHLYVEKLRRQADHLEKLINALLTLSRIDAGVLEMEKKSLDIYSVLQLSLDTLDELIREKSIRVTLPNHSEVTIQGDMEWSMEAYINLIKNCIEHTPEGGLICIDYTQNPLYTEVEIADNGEGFQGKELPHIFERFYQGGNAAGKGIGLGLSFAKALIEKQGGLISAKNRPSGGACFTIRYYRH